MFSGSYFADFVGIVVRAKIELSRVGEFSLADHLQGC